MNVIAYYAITSVGSKVVTRRITLESILEVKEVLKREPLIWDNLHANDYDQTRLYLGKERPPHAAHVLSSAFELFSSHTLCEANAF